jgi:eukaryotic-like serine/threonine-protein kinase
MRDDSKVKDLSLPLAVLEWIDRVCLDFEAAWKKGHRPCIEDYLGAAQGAERNRLFRELLLLDLDYRSRGDDPPSEDEYRARFPQDSELVRDVFEELSTDAAVTETNPHRSVPISHGPTLPCQFGDYELLEVLGEGGMGVVYRARQQTPERIVALKVIRPDRLAAMAFQQRERVIERFRAETRAAASLEHDHIVPIYEVGQIDGQPFFTMRYIQGRGLEERLRDGPLAGRDVAALLEPVARALHFAHSRGIVHRDVKPRNILLDSDGKPYIADFGLAKSFAAGQDLTQTAEVIGTPAYMSPEQAQGAAGVGHRTDVYSLGVTLYELLTGRPPFRAATVAETQRQVVENEPVPPRQLNPAIDRDAETICLKCLEKEPANRYATAEQLADELQRFRRGEPIRSRPVGRIQRCWRWSRRKPWAALAVALLLLLGVGSPPVAYYQYYLTRKIEGSLEETRVALVRATKAEGDAKQAERDAKQAEEDAKEAQKTAESEAAANRRTLYISDMKRMEALSTQAELRTMRSLLARHIPGPGAVDLRDFEWFYWQRQCRRELSSLKHGERVELMAFTPDDRFMATSGVLDRDTALSTVMVGKTSEGIPTANVVDGRVHAVRIWDLTTGRLERTFAESKSGHQALAFFPAPTTLMVIGADHTQQQWDWRTGSLLKSQRGFYGSGSESFDQRREAYAFAASVRFFAGSNMSSVSLSGEGTAAFNELRVIVPGGIRHWISHTLMESYSSVDPNELRYGDVKSWLLGDELTPPAEEDGGTVFSLALSPDEKMLAAGSRHGELFIWNLTDGSEQMRVAAHDDIIWDIAFSPAGQRLATASKDGLVRIWDLSGGGPLVTIAGHAGAVRAVALSRTGLLASGGEDNTVRIWSAATGGPIAEHLGHEQTVTDVAFGKDAETVWSASRDGTVKQWTVRDEDQPIVIADQTPLHCLDVASDGRTLAAAGSSGQVAVWDLGSRRLKFSPAHKHDQIFHVRFASGDDAVVAVSSDGILGRWDTKSGALISQRSVPIRRNIFGMAHVAISPDGQRIAGQGEDGKVRIVDLESDHEVLLPTDLFISRVLFSPDGGQLLTTAHRLDAANKVSATADLKLWHARTGEFVGDVSTDVRVTGLALSSNGKYLAWCERNGNEGGEAPSSKIVVWDLTLQAETRRLDLPPDVPNVQAMALSPDGARVASLSAGDPKADPPGQPVLIVWDASTGEVIQQVPESGRFAMFTSDGQWLAVAGYDGRVRLRDATAAVATYELECPSGPVFNATFTTGGTALAVTGHTPSLLGRSPTIMSQTTLTLDEPMRQKQRSYHVQGQKRPLFEIADGTLMQGGGLWKRLSMPRQLGSFPFSQPPFPQEAYSIDTDTVFGAKLIVTLRGHEGYVHAMAFSRDGSRLASGGADHTVRVWDTEQVSSNRLVNRRPQSV